MWASIIWITEQSSCKVIFPTIMKRRQATNSPVAVFKPNVGSVPISPNWFTLSLFVFWISHHKFTYWPIASYPSLFSVRSKNDQFLWTRWKFLGCSGCCSCGCRGGNFSWYKSETNIKGPFYLLSHQELAAERILLTSRLSGLRTRRPLGSTLDNPSTYNYLLLH